MARHIKRSRSRRIPKQPQTIYELVAAGGPETLVKAAAEAAARQERKFWLDVLEGINQDDLDEQDQMFCGLYIQDLRRRLGISHSKEMIREQTRLRVRRFRERRARPIQ